MYLPMPLSWPEVSLIVFKSAKSVEVFQRPKSLKTSGLGYVNNTEVSNLNILTQQRGLFFLLMHSLHASEKLYCQKKRK